MAVWLLVGVGMASRWPLVHDAPLMHYVVFAMDHGQVPYRDIVEMNMPGTYVIEGAAMHALGGGAFGWWLWDALLGLLAVLSSAWMAGPGRRSAGVVGGGMAYLFHLSDGAWNLGQRDWTVAALLLVGFGCLFAALRRRQPVWMAGFLCFCGLAASIKPPVIGIGVVFVAAVCWLVGRGAGGFDGLDGADGFDEVAPGWEVYAVWAGVGFLAPCALVVGFLLHWGNTKEFLGLLHGLVAYYASLQRMSFRHLVVASLHLKAVLVPALVVFALGRFSGASGLREPAWRRRDAGLLLLAAVCGAGLFVVQGKGWDYHLYPELAFALVWAMVALQGALERAGERRGAAVLAAVTVLFASLGLVPKMLLAERRAVYPMATVRNLQRDLTELEGEQLGEPGLSGSELGRAELSGKVQCLDMTLGGCVNVLYRMRLLQATGYIYDFYLFPEHGTAVTAGLQAGFLGQVRARPPELMVLSSQSWPGDARGYGQLGNWPAFRDWLESHYRVVRESPVQAQTAGYRIYALRGEAAGVGRP